MNAPADLSDIHDRLKGHCERMDRLEAIMLENKNITAQVAEILESGKAAFVLMGHFGRFAKWVGTIAAAFAAVWAAWHLGPDK